jgi:glycogen synthase
MNIHTEEKQVIRPTEDEIEDTITKIYDRLDLPAINKALNAAVKEGYEEAINILVDDKNNYFLISSNLKTVQGRAIAVLAVDYLNGECTQEVLLGVPIKEKLEWKLKK